MDSGNLSKVDLLPKNITDYQIFTPEVVEQIYNLAKSLKGLRIAHLNATPLGGGVAEMLKFIVPVQQNLGIESSWYIIPPDQDFFEVTKAIHNFLQGKEGNLTPKQQEIYLEYNKRLAKMIEKIEADVLIIHDPQPAAALSFANKKFPKTLWRCHIDTSTPNQSVWNFLLPYLKTYNHFVFTMAEYANQNLPQDKITTITPVIDPLSPKNQLREKKWARNYLTRFGVDPHKPLLTQVSRLDPWKDPLGVIDTFLLAKKEEPSLQLALVAQMASDDPEGNIILAQVQRYLVGKKDVFLLVNLPDNDLAVNAFQSGSDIIIQKSIREGFGLTVTEAMWKKAAVIGGNTGGIKLQIQDNRNGFLVNTVEEAACCAVLLMENPLLRENLAESAHLFVKDNFLLPHKIAKYLNLFQALFSSTKERSEQNPVIMEKDASLSLNPSK